MCLWHRVEFLAALLAAASQYVLVEHIEIVAIASVIPASDGLHGLKRAQTLPFSNDVARALEFSFCLWFSWCYDCWCCWWCWCQRKKCNKRQAKYLSNQFSLHPAKGYGCQGQDEEENMQSLPTHIDIRACAAGKVDGKFWSQRDKWHLNILFPLLVG